MDWNRRREWKSKQKGSKLITSSNTANTSKKCIFPNRMLRNKLRWRSYGIRLKEKTKR